MPSKTFYSDTCQSSSLPPLFSLPPNINASKLVYLAPHSFNTMLSLNNFTFSPSVHTQKLPKHLLPVQTTLSYSMHIPIFTAPHPRSSSLDITQTHQTQHNQNLNLSSACALHFKWRCSYMHPRSHPWPAPVPPTFNHQVLMISSPKYFPSIPSFYPCPNSGLLNLLTRLFQQAPNWSLIPDLFLSNLFSLSLAKWFLRKNLCLKFFSKFPLQPK